MAEQNMMVEIGLLLVVAALVTAIAVGEAQYANRLKDILREMRDRLSRRKQVLGAAESLLVDEVMKLKSDLERAECTFRWILAGFWAFSAAAPIALVAVLILLWQAGAFTRPPRFDLAVVGLVAIVAAAGWLFLVVAA